MKTSELLPQKNVNGVTNAKWPLVIRRSGIEVKIYHRREKGQRYDCFTVTHYELGKRQLNETEHAI